MFTLSQICPIYGQSFLVVFLGCQRYISNVWKPKKALNVNLPHSMRNINFNTKWNLINSGKKSKCCLYCNNAHCGKFLLLLMSAYENTNACKIFKLSNKASKCLSSSKKIDIYILDMAEFNTCTKFYQVLITYPLKWTIMDILPTK